MVSSFEHHQQSLIRQYLVEHRRTFPLKKSRYPLAELVVGALLGFDLGMVPAPGLVLVVEGNSGL